MKCCLTGYNRGLGKIFHDYYKSIGWEVVGFNSKDSVDSIVKKSLNCDLFINNSYADGKQIEFLNQLHNFVEKMIICGSVASDFPDPLLPEYSQNKKELEKRFLEISDHSKSQMLLLKLSSDAYNNPKIIIDTIEFWFKNPKIKVVTFVATQEPNR